MGGKSFVAHEDTGLWNFVVFNDTLQNNMERAVEHYYIKYLSQFITQLSGTRQPEMILNDTTE